MENTPGVLPGFWSLSQEEALRELSCSSKGLNDAEAAKRLKTYGRNTIKANTGSSAILLFLSQFKSPVTLLLIIAALLSAGLAGCYRYHHYSHHSDYQQLAWFLAGKRRCRCRSANC